MALHVSPHRRAFLLTGLAAGAFGGLAPAAFADTAPGAIAFEVRRGDALIGHHRMTFTRDGGALLAEADVDMTVKLGPISLFRYAHQAHERWVDGRFDSLQTSSLTNGKRQAVSARRTPQGVMITPAEGAPYVAGADALPLTHWNRQVMRAPLFNPQDGKPMRERARALGPDSVPLSDGRMVAAERYALTGENQIDDWYDDQGQWTALQAKAKDGSMVVYRRVPA